MKRTLTLVALAGASLLSQAATVTSTFDSDNEGWTTLNNDGFVPTWAAGQIQSADIVEGWAYLAAPAAYLAAAEYGALFSFELRDDIDVFAFMNRLRVVVLSSNLGDNRTLAIPVAHTIYFEMGAERRASMGIADSLVRVSVGIEDSDDLIDDFAQALAG